MKNNKALITFLLSFLPIYSQAEALSVLNWEDYMSESVIQKWETESGTKIEQVLFDNDEKRDAILMKPDHHSIDVAVVDESVAERFGTAGLLVELTEENVPSISNTGEFWRQRCGNYAVPYFWGTLGIVYRSDKVSTPPTSWKELLQPNEQLKGHIGMMNDYVDMLAPALFLQGHNLNSENTSELSDAFELLKAQAKDVLTYEYAITYLNIGQRKDDLYMALAYGGDQYSLNDIADQEDLWKYTIPSEGTVLWVDCLAIPSSSKNINSALAFINFLNQPQIAALNAEEVYVATPNEAALEIVSEEYRQDSEVFPSKDILNKSDLYRPLNSESVEQRLRITNAVLNIHESQ